MILAGALVAGCAAAAPKLTLSRVILYQNGIGYFERTGVVGGDRLVLGFSRHEVDDVMKTLTVLDRSGASVTTVDVPRLGEHDDRIAIGVKLSGGRAHDVLVSYAVPTPTWKAAYRVVLDDKADRPSGLLQGWAVIDNASQEDWVGVALTLATGAPMSYALDLHTPTYVDRPDATGKLVSPVVLGPVTGEKVGAAAGDKDGDGIPDQDDLCPNDPEDKDGFEDGDGCPDPDNDKDRIPDRLDKCPNDPETYNGFEDDDGCPDRGRVIVTDSALEILDLVYFASRGDEIRAASQPIVDAIAATLVGNPEILKIEIGGHAASDEPDPWGLSSRRAGAVRAALIKHGVEAGRLELVPYGATRPVDPKVTEAAHAKNRRVAFTIRKRASDAEPVRRPATPVVDVASVQASAHPATRPVEVAGAVRYELGAPVTVRRGASTMVSILNKSISAEDAYLWRPDGNAPGSDRHPFRAVRLVNATGFTLQPGPVAIFARGTFVGDSLLDRLDLDETAWIPYALDSGTTVTVTTTSTERPVRIASIHRGVLTVENAGVRTTKYTISAGRQAPRQIYLRHARASGYTATDLPPGTLDQGDSVLVPLPLQAGTTSELAIDEREPRRRTIELVSTTAELAAYVSGSTLPAGLGDRLNAAAALRKELAALEDEVGTARDRFTDVVLRAEEIRDSLRALDRVAGADDLRRKLVASLRETTQASDTLIKTIESKSAALATVRSRLQDAIRELSLDEPKP